MSCVDEEVDCSEAGSHERPPPPVVVFGGEMKVTKKNGSLGTSNDQNKSHKKQKTEHVVDLMRPN